MKKLLSIVGAASIALSSLFMFPESADASIYSKRYTWYKYTGRVYLYDGYLSRYQVAPGNTDMSMRIKFKLPRCPSGYRLKGGVYARFDSFKGNTTGWKKLFYTSGSTYYEGKVLTRTAYSTSGLNRKGGSFRAKSTIKCVTY